jgi:multiple sugar transport system substrate-binding protein/putative aldouronate transport system substrate-binding protein
MALSLTGCGTSSTDSGKKEEATATTASSSSEENVTSETEGYGNAIEGDLSDIIPKETVTLDVYSRTANYSGEQIGWFAKVIKDKFNVVLNIVPDPDYTVYTTRMEAGDMGDIVIWGANDDKYQDAIAKNMLMDWNEDDLLTDYGPYIKEHLQNALQKNTDISGGTTYGLGNNIGVNPTDISAFTYAWSTRWDLYKKLGYPKVKNMDEFADVLIQMQKLEPTDENGKKTFAVSLFSDWDGAMAMFPKSMVTAYYGYDEFGIGFYDPKTQSFIPAVAEDSPYVELLKFYNKLYQAGAMDPDSETQGFDGCAEDYRNGTALFTPFSFLGGDSFNSKTHIDAGKGMFTLIPEEATPINYGQNIYGADYVWSIGNNTEYPELCMAIINWLSTPEGAMTELYGPKDLCWYYDENGKTHFTDLGLACATDGETPMTDGYSGIFRDGQDKMNITTWATDAENPDSNGETYNRKYWESNVSAAASDIEADWRKYAGADSTDEYLASRPYTLSPGTTYSPTPKSDSLTVTWNQVSESVKNYSWKAMFASSDAEFDSIIKEMITTAESYGLADCNDYQKNEATKRKAAEDAALAAVGK